MHERDTLGHGFAFLVARGEFAHHAHKRGHAGNCGDHEVARVAALVVEQESAFRGAADGEPGRPHGHVIEMRREVAARDQFEEELEFGLARR